MLPTTVDAVRALLKADPSVTPADRGRIVGLIRDHGREPQVEKPERIGTRIMRRAEVARRFGRSLRFVDNLAVEGVLTRVQLPGRKRACGYREDEVERVLAGSGVPDGNE